MQIIWESRNRYMRGVIMCSMRVVLFERKCLLAVRLSGPHELLLVALPLSELVLPMRRCEAQHRTRAFQQRMLRRGVRSRRSDRRRGGLIANLVLGVVHHISEDDRLRRFAI